jgi:penicillin-binding protein 1C
MGHLSSGTSSKRLNDEAEDTTSENENNTQESSMIQNGLPLSQGRTSRMRRRGSYIQIGKFQISKIVLIRAIALVFLGGILLSILGFFVTFALVARNLPDPENIVRKAGYSTKLYDRNGVLLYDMFANERRYPVTSDQIPEYLKQATVATEDKDFYKHPGFDPLTPFRMGWHYVTTGKVIGGSTLTQQLVKNVLLSSERTVTRKFRELVLALEIERKFTKDQILLMYLNESPYGGSAYGVSAAAEQYFDKKVSELNLVESAIIAGLPQRPTAYSPFLGKKDSNGQPMWKSRTIGVLRRMREDGYISAELEKDAVAQLDSVQFRAQRIDIQAPHFVFYVKSQLEEMYGPEIVENGGLMVTTTLDLPIQNESQKIVYDEIMKVSDKYHITNGSAVMMDPRSGEILAMVGSRDFFDASIDGQFNVAVDGLRQPGSSIKPVTYLTALQRGFSPASMVLDTPTSFPGGAGQKDYEPKNYDGKFHGPVPLQTALGSSLNIPAVKLLATVGVKSMLSNAYEMGISTLEPTTENMRNFGLSVTLGGGEVRLIDMAPAYSTFPRGGETTQAVSILKVVGSDGKILYEHRPVTGKRVMTEQESFLMNKMLSNNEARMVAFGPSSLLNYGDKPIAVKTGTTNDRKDNWTIGWSRSTLVGVWVGNNDGTGMKSVASGITGASPIWRKIMDYALKQGRIAEDWTKPDGVEEVELDAISGYQSHDGFPVKKY